MDQAGPPQKLSCGAVLVRETATGWLVLMLRAYGNWDFPKGMRETGESPLQAARREVAEETGIHDLDLTWGERYLESDPYSHGKVARYYLMQTSTERVTMGISPVLGRPEHHEHRWVTFDEAYDLSSPRVRLVVQWARQVVGG